MVDEHHHRSSTPTSPGNDFDPLSTQRIDENTTVGIVAHLTDEPRAASGTQRAHRNICRAATSPTQHDGAGIGRNIDRAAEAHDNVLHEVSNSCEHGRDGTGPMGPSSHPQSRFRSSLWQSLFVDLQTWIEADYASIATRFNSAIAKHVPIERWKDVPPGGGSCIAGLLMHTTYHEDLAINTAIRNHAPLIDQHRTLLGIDHLSRAAGLSETEDRTLVEAVDLDQLRAYVSAVTDATTEWLNHLSMMALDSVPSASWQLEHKAGLATAGLEWLHSMWTDKAVSWFVQWECIGHRHGHLGEMIGIRGRLGLSPF